MDILFHVTTEAGAQLLPPLARACRRGHHAFAAFFTHEGFAYLPLLRAGHGVAARLYAEGWAEWAADGALPADSVSHPDRAQPAAEKSQPPQGGGTRSPALLAVTLVLVVTAFIAGWFARRRAA